MIEIILREHIAERANDKRTSRPIKVGGLRHSSNSITVGWRIDKNTKLMPLHPHNVLREETI